MSTRRTYGDVCGLSRALDRIGERWALMIVRELLLGPKRFTDLRGGLPNLGPDVLTQRLRDLQGDGLVEKHRLPPPAAAQVYALTPRGLELAPVIDAIALWGARIPLTEADARLSMSFDAHVLSFRTLFDPAAAGDLELTVALVLDERPYRARVADGTFTLEAGAAPDAPLTIAGPVGDVLAVAHGRMAWTDAPLTVDGDAELARRFLGLFRLPAPASV